jgi:hypothetical protein
MAWYSAPMPRTKPAMKRPRVFFRHHQRIVEQRQRTAEDRELGALDRARQCAGQHARDRHHAIGGLVVFVQAHAVEAEPVGQFHLVEIFVIEFRALARIVVPVGIGDPCGAVLVDRVEVGVAIGHQVEVEELHAATLMLSMNAVSSETKTLGFSTCGMCPHSGMITAFAPGINC